jgi:hypothetical protein
MERDDSVGAVTRRAERMPQAVDTSPAGSETWRPVLIAYERAIRTGEGSIVLTGGAMTDSRVASERDSASARMLRRAAKRRRWLGALNTFLGRAFLQADVDTGCWPT